MTPLAPQDLVLLQDTFNDRDMSQLAKFRPKWRGPFQIKIAHTKVYYQIKELDRTPLPNTIASNRLKIFYPRGEAMDQRINQEHSNKDSNAGLPIKQPPNNYNQDIPQAPARRVIRVQIPLKPNIDRSEYQKFH
jgi:hypothetical protein